MLVVVGVHYRLFNVRNDSLSTGVSSHSGVL